MTEENSKTMAEVKHTRWEVEDYGSPGDLEGVLSQYAVLDSGGIPIAYALTPNEARLIAAAPDLLETAEEFCRRVEAGEIRSKRSYAAFKAAIARARGEQSPNHSDKKEVGNG